MAVITAPSNDVTHRDVVDFTDDVECSRNSGTVSLSSGKDISGSLDVDDISRSRTIVVDASDTSALESFGKLFVVSGIVNHKFCEIIFDYQTVVIVHVTDFRVVADSQISFPWGIAQRMFP